MIKRNLYLFVFCIITCCIVIAISYNRPPVSKSISKHISTLMKISFDVHVAKNSMTPELGSQMLTNYIEMLDPNKTYLLEEDVKQAYANKINIPIALKNNQWNFPTNIFANFIKRVEAQHTNAIIYLSSPDFKIDESREVIVDAKKVGYAKNMTEANARTQDNIQYQVAYLLSLDEPLTNAISKIKKRYSRNLKRFLDLDSEKQFALFINAFCLALDPHTSYLSKDDMDDFEIHMALSLEGIGAVLSSPEGITEVKSLSPGGPAEKSGLLKAGDKIVAVAQGQDGDFVDIIDMDIRDVVKHIRGKKDTVAKLKIVRNSADGVIRKDICITRDKVKLEDQAPQLQFVDVVTTNNLKQISKKKIGVIDLPSFYLDPDSRKRFGEYSRSAVSDVTRLLKKCKEAKVDGVILDMQRNGGGLLDEAVYTAGLFIKKGNVVLARNKANQIQVLPDTNIKLNYDGPLIITVSRATASAAEIVSGALKDYNRAIIVGSDHTFGKGTIQQVIPLTEDLGAIKITSGEYFIASGNSPQNKGVIADIVIPSDLSAFEIGETYQTCALPSPKTASKLSPAIQTGADGSNWKTVKQNEIDILRSNSTIRIANSSIFSNMQARIEKNIAAREKFKLSIAEILKTNKTNTISKSEIASTNKIDDVLAENIESTNSITNNVLVSEAINIMIDWLDLPKKELKSLTLKVDKK